MRNARSSRPALFPVHLLRGGLVLLLLLTGCQSKTPEEELVKAVQPVGSWLASLEMTGRQWSANSVPASFVRSATKSADKEIEKASEAAEKSTARPGLRDPIRALLAEAKDAGDSLRRAVDQGDRAGVAREVGRLGALHQRFDTLTKGLEE
ncbi:MAG TPA: hypothetical protein VH394_00790 [Thermoanaerobaculia bacterium]|jgi:hypothetical protein|nr:hypothetical protein [Thermoanaerobaculia bacterium]